MKKIALILLALCMTVAFAACADSGDTSSSTDSKTTSSQTSSTSSVADASSEESANDESSDVDTDDDVDQYGGKIEDDVYTGTYMSFSVPEGWDFDEYFTSIVNPDDEHSYIQYMVEAVDEDSPINMSEDDIVAMHEDMYKDIEVLKFETTEEDGITTMHFDISCTYDGLDINVYSILISDDSSLLIIAVTTTEDGEELAYEVFDSIELTLDNSIDEE